MKIRKRIKQYILVSIIQILAVTSYGQHIEQLTVSSQNEYASSYMITQSGYGIAKGFNFYRNINVGYQYVGFGLTQNFSLGVGQEFFSPIVNRSFPMLTISPKFNLPIIHNKLNVAIGLQTAVTFKDKPSVEAGLAYATITYGSRQNNISIGSGFYIDSNNISDLTPIFLSFTKKITNKVSLISENIYWYDYLEPEDSYLLFGLTGMIHFQHHKALQIGFWLNPGGISLESTLPYLAFSMPIGGAII